MNWLIASIAAALLSLSCASSAAAQPVDPGRPIPGAGNWMLRQRLPGMPGLTCSVRSAGAEVNTTLLLNDERRPIILLARPDWAGLRGQARVQLSIDGGAPVEIETSMVHNLVMTALRDETLVQRLRDAETLVWTLPLGRFQSTISGLGAALDALTACRPDPKG
jgi:hypothetical protein